MNKPFRLCIVVLIVLLLLGVCAPRCHASPLQFLVTAQKLDSFIGGKDPGQPMIEAPNTAPNLGVNLQLPSKDIPSDPVNVAEWRRDREILAALPKGVPVRVPLYAYGWAWDKNLEYGFEHVDAEVRFMAQSGHPVIWEVTLLPWPGSFGWAPTSIWGAVALEDFPALDAKFKRFVVLLRQSMARNGMVEKGTGIQVGNEPGSGHPGGNVGNPFGEWNERTGSLYVKYITGTDFGAMTLYLPPISFQDADPATALRERVSAGTILKKLARAKRGGGTVATTHVRLYAPNLSTVEYVTALLIRIDVFLKTARELSGRPTAISTEFYVFREDRGAVDDRADILRLVAPRLPVACFLYKVGSGGGDPSTEIPVENVRASTVQATLGTAEAMIDASYPREYAQVR